jgi:hypothetical protein
LRQLFNALLAIASSSPILKRSFSNCSPGKLKKIICK